MGQWSSDRCNMIVVEWESGGIVGQWKGAGTVGQWSSEDDSETVGKS